MNFKLQGKHPILLLESTNNRSVLSLIEKARRLHAEGIIFVHFEDDNMKPEVVHSSKPAIIPLFLRTSHYDAYGSRQ
jgi:hypothetical protein